MQKTLKHIIFLLLFIFSDGILLGVPNPSPNGTKRSHDISWIQYGFRIGYNFALDSKYSATDVLSQSQSAEFGGYIRLGKIIYGEIGLGYMFHKGTYDTQLIQNERIETRYLQIPLKVVGYLPLGEKFALTPNIGVIYQPLLKVTKNEIDYNRSTLTNQQFYFTGGLGLKIKFVTVDVAYRKAFCPFFSDKASKKNSFCNVSLGFQF